MSQAGTAVVCQYASRKGHDAILAVVQAVMISQLLLTTVGEPFVAGTLLALPWRSPGLVGRQTGGQGGPPAGGFLVGLVGLPERSRSKGSRGKRDNIARESLKYYEGVRGGFGRAASIMEWLVLNW